LAGKGEVYFALMPAEAYKEMIASKRPDVLLFEISQTDVCHTLKETFEL